MPQKLSPYKVSKMLALFFSGHSQSDIAKKLKIDQSTVSVHVSKFKSSVEQQGIKVAGEEFGIMDQIEALHSLASELKKAKLTVEEAKASLKVELLFAELGIKPESYKDVMQACTKMKSEGFLTSAVKLNKLEQITSMTYEEIVAQFASTCEGLKKAQQDMQIATGKLSASKEELVSIENQKKLASQKLEAQMKQLGVDMNRLKLVEDLALALKQGGISNKELQGYIERQQLLNEAGISLGVFASILEKAKVVTSHDHGQELLQMLSEYGSLNQTIKALEGKVELLAKEAGGLEEQAKLKGKTEAEIAKLKAKKASLEAQVAALYDQKNLLDKVKNEVTPLSEKKAMLVHEISELETRKGVLTDEIKAKAQKVSDLAELESKRAVLLDDISTTKAKLDQEEVRLAICESFFGLIDLSSLTELVEFAEVLPSLLNQVKQGKYSPQLLRNVILDKLGGNKLQLLKCTNCQARFAVDKLPDLGRHYCPICGFSHTVVVDQDATAILKAALNALKPKLLIVQRLTPPPEELKPKDNSTS